MSQEKKIDPNIDIFLPTSESDLEMKMIKYTHQIPEKKNLSHFGNVLLKC